MGLDLLPSSHSSPSSTLASPQTGAGPVEVPVVPAVSVSVVVVSAVVPVVVVASVVLVPESVIDALVVVGEEVVGSTEVGAVDPVCSPVVLPVGSAVALAVPSSLQLASASARPAVNNAFQERGETTIGEIVAAFAGDNNVRGRASAWRARS